MTAMDEQETTVTACRADDVVQIYTTDTRHLKKLRRHPNVVEKAGTEEYGFFLVPLAFFDPLTGFKRAKRERTEEEKQRARERMAKARAAKAK
jgi:hypothetical protein